MRLVQRIIAILIIQTIFFSYFSFVYSKKGDCSDLLVVFARGSGQQQFKKEDQPQAYSFFSEIEKRTPPDVKLETQELIYPASGGWDDYIEAELSWTRAHVGGGFRFSVDHGVRNTMKLLREQNQRCPDQKFVLGGYSQGGNVMGNVVFGVGDKVAENIVYVALFGDPKFKADSFASRGTYDRYSGGIMEPRKQEFPESFRGKIHSFCKDGDGICENIYAKAVGPLSRHSTYTEIEIPIAANEAAHRLRNFFPYFGIEPIVDLNQKMDIVFVVDSTSNHRDRYANLMNNIERITKITKKSFPDLRVGFVHYKDYIPSENQSSFISAPLTADVDEFTKGVAKYPRAGGGDGIKESVYSGLATASAMQWRPDAQKKIILIPYSLPHDPEPKTFLTQQSIINQLIVNGNASVETVIDDFTVKNYTHIAEVYHAISEATGGSVHSFSRRNDSLSKGVEKALKNISLKPILSKKLTQNIVLNEKTLLSVAGVYPGIGSLTQYEWDFDNDGIYEFISDMPNTYYTFTSAFEGQIKVRVSNSLGDSIVVPISVKVLRDMPTITPPTEPKNLRIDYADDAPGHQINVAFLSFSSIGMEQNRKKANISWEKPDSDGGSPIDHYSIYGDGTLIGIVPANRLSVVVSSIPRNVIISVSASNSAGFSRKSYVSTSSEDLGGTSKEQEVGNGDTKTGIGSELRSNISDSDVFIATTSGRQASVYLSEDSLAYNPTRVFYYKLVFIIIASIVLAGLNLRKHIRG
jgi:PKD repeat protein